MAINKLIQHCQGKCSNAFAYAEVDMGRFANLLEVLSFFFCKQITDINFFNIKKQKPLYKTRACLQFT